MNSRNVRPFVLSLLALSLMAAGCTCISVPASDATPPVATTRVSFTNPIGVGVERYVNTTDRNSPVTVHVPPRTPFTILYFGNDSGGVKTMVLDSKYYTNGQPIQPPISPDDYSGGSCVTELRMKATELPWQNQVRNYEFQTTVTDFHNNSSTTPKLTVHHGDGPFKAGFRVVTNIPISPGMSFTLSEVGIRGQTFRFERPARNTAIIFYPGMADGLDTPVAAAGPFPLIVFGHARRVPWSHPCQSAPSDTTQDFRQLSVVLRHLATWGFVTISPDLSWLGADNGVANRQIVLEDAISYMVGQNVFSGSPFNSKVKTTGFGVSGHSAAGSAAIHLATSGQIPIDAMGLIAPAAGTTSDVSQIQGFAPKPVLILNGTRDAGPFSVGGAPQGIYGAAGITKHLVTIDGANHFGYTDEVCIGEDGTATISQANQQRIAKAYLAAFFRRYLNGDTVVDDYLLGVRLIEEIEGLNVTVQAQR